MVETGDSIGRYPNEEEWVEILAIDWDPTLRSVLQEVKENGGSMNATSDGYRDLLNGKLEIAGLYKKYFVVWGSVYVR